MTNYDQIVYDTSIQQGFKPEIAKYIVAQARLESSDYGSNVFKCNNNMYGTKFANQPLASKGTLAPQNEISSTCMPSGSGCQRTGIGSCRSIDFYARYSSPNDGIKDTIERYYKKTISGVSFDDLNNSTDIIDFAKKLKQRRYFGLNDINTPQGQAEAISYATLLKAKLIKIQVVDFYNQNKNAVNIVLVSVLGIALISYLFYVKKKVIN